MIFGILEKFGIEIGEQKNFHRTFFRRNGLAKKIGKYFPRSKILENTLLKRPGTTKEVAHLAVFLASNESSYITGQTFNVNGGLLLS